MALTDTAPVSSSATHRKGPRWLWVGVGAAVFVVVALVITGLRPDAKFPFVPNEVGMATKPTPEQAPYLTPNHIGEVVIFTLIGLIGVAISVRMSIKGRSLLPLMVALSGAMIVVPEVFYDVIGAVYFPHSDTEPFGYSFTILGREMPVSIIAGWFGYGVFTVMTFAMLTLRPTTRTLWYAWGAALAGDVVMEELLLHFDLYHYYGNQPLVLLFQLPWWWMPCNSVGVMLAAAIAYRFRDKLRGPAAVVMLVVTPMSVTAIYGFIALPSWIAVNGDFPWFTTQILGLATLVLGVFAFMGVLKFVLNRDPLDLAYKPTEEEEFLRVR